MLYEPMLISGELVCRARRGSRDGPWQEVPLESWEAGLKVVDAGLLCRRELHEERIRAQDGTITLRERQAAAEVWYEPRFALADTAPACRAFSLPKLERWFADEYVPALNGRIPTRDETIAAAKAKWPGAPHRAIEALKSKYLPGTRGRPRK